MKKKVKRKTSSKSSGNAIFESKDGMERLRKFELNKFYIVMGGEVVGFEDEENPISIISGHQVEKYVRQLEMTLREIIGMPKNHKERKEAIAGLASLKVMPFKLH